MPEGRSIFENGYSPTGVLTHGDTPSSELTPEHMYDDRSMRYKLYEMHINTQFSTIYRANQSKTYVNVSELSFRRSISLVSMHGRQELIYKNYQSRTRLPAYQLYQQRDLRHGGQGSITINNPIMEE